METEIRKGDWWTTPTVTLMLKNHRELNHALERIVLTEEERLSSNPTVTPVAGVTSGLTAQWLTYNVLNWNYPEIIKFREWVVRGIREFCRHIGGPRETGMAIRGISCWANVLRSGQALSVHHHDPAYLSGHYTVITGHDDGDDAEDGMSDSGHTVYFRPGFIERSHGGKAAAMASPWDEEWCISVKPTAGKLFLFPSYVRHEVRPYLGRKHRISIAMDVFIERQQYPMHFRGPRWYVPGPSPKE